MFNLPDSFGVKVKTVVHNSNCCKYWPIVENLNYWQILELEETIFKGLGNVSGNKLQFVVGIVQGSLAQTTDSIIQRVPALTIFKLYFYHNGGQRTLMIYKFANVRKTPIIKQAFTLKIACKISRKI